MYRSVLVNPNQRDLQLIVWRDEPSKPLAVYKLNTVTYGTASAPFLSVRCLKQLAAECSDLEVKRVINNDIYVDDLLTSSDDKVKLLKICKGTVDALKSGCFTLRKWVFNFEVREGAYPMSPNDNNIIDTFRNLNFGEHSQCRTLGLGWCNVSDDFNFNTQLQQATSNVTKRTILSSVSQIFDPLGLLSPSIIIGKVLLQRLWLLKLQWDDPLPADILRTWNRFVDSLSHLSSIKIPRHAFQCDGTRVELHIFTDASQTAYGACAYVRTVCDDRVVVKLLMSKGKVAPLKPVSIPRLELCGALLGAKLYDKDYYPLSPGHFLIGRPLTAPVCEDDLQHLPVHRLSRYQRVEQLRQQFWTRWASEYISELQIRAKWRENAELKPDTLVLIKDVALPPLKWQLGRVVRTIPGDDGIARVADIRTASGVIRRSYTKICPLVREE
ncbi:uncharacterized protein LOC121734441 [Aricia agestis]|uniref:uncharacterized protein LOC121734441 n=1 Tax=Aricia agestis TaxID=91739 RepID=UPI001C206927|nr:uncharacterized protein LOC121734441 [Aricia agestis]